MSPDIHSEIERLRKENRELKQCLVSMLHEDILIDRQMLLASFGKGPTLDQLIEEIENLPEAM